MRNVITCLLVAILLAGCNRNPQSSAPPMNHNPDNTWTIDALQRNDVASIKQRVMDDAQYIHERDFVGDTPLMSAIGSDNLELVQLMLKHGADPNAAVDDGYTCLLLAVESDHPVSIAIVAELIAKGANIHAHGINDWTPLHLAAARGHVEKARLLLNAGARIDRRTKIDGSVTPLMEAASMGHPAMVKLLLEHGASTTLRDTVFGHTPLEMAIAASKGPDPAVVEYFSRPDVQKEYRTLPKELDISPEQRDMLNGLMKETDIGQQYIESTTRRAQTQDYAEVIRLLTDHQRR